ncbi:hypothetical protein FRB99_005602 [Tulasnella sp. 403]|nr:hypothetical protein FRB99_005602 [Tulasnella sp. 403]
MPTGTPYAGHIRPYDNIRVDAFFTPRDKEYKHANLLFLTHTHSDHVQGLSNPSFGSNVVCSKDAKHMLLSYEPGSERDKPKRTRPYTHLEGAVQTSADKSRPPIRRKLLKTIELNTPTPMEVNAKETVTVTAFDANHCPGSVMYLIEGKKGAILHTGDIRCEAAFVQSLKSNPFLQPYIPPPRFLKYQQTDASLEPVPVKRLEAIYLDTACLTMHFDQPPKIHLDKYKYRVYTGLSNPMFQYIFTQDGASTRFHACDRFNRCEHVPIEGEHIVYLNPSDMSHLRWEAYLGEQLEALRAGTVPTSLKVAFSRHSGLPELRSLVGLFRPKRVVPCTVLPKFEGRDWAAIPHLFRDELPPEAAELIWSEMRECGVGLQIPDELLREIPQFDEVDEFESFSNTHGNVLEMAKMDFSIFLKEQCSRPGEARRRLDDGYSTDESKCLEMHEGDSEDDEEMDGDVEIVGPSDATLQVNPAFLKSQPLVLRELSLPKMTPPPTPSSERRIPLERPVLTELDPNSLRLPCPLSTPNNSFRSADKGNSSHKFLFTIPNPNNEPDLEHESMGPQSVAEQPASTCALVEYKPRHTPLRSASSNSSSTLITKEKKMQQHAEHLPPVPIASLLRAEVVETSAHVSRATITLPSRPPPRKRKRSQPRRSVTPSVEKHDLDLESHDHVALDGSLVLEGPIGGSLPKSLYTRTADQKGKKRERERCIPPSNSDSSAGKPKKVVSMRGPTDPHPDYTTSISVPHQRGGTPSNEVHVIRATRPSDPLALSKHRCAQKALQMKVSQQLRENGSEYFTGRTTTKRRLLQE